MTSLSLYISHWWRQTWDTRLYFTVVSQSEARVNTEHAIKEFTTMRCWLEWLVLVNTRARVCCMSHCRAACCRAGKMPLQWRHNGRDSVSNHQPHDCLLKRLFRCRSKKTSKLRVTGLCVGNSPGTGEFPAQMASNAENVSIWWRHHARVLRCEPAWVVTFCSTSNSEN